jgi:hypothetical protein
MSNIGDEWQDRWQRPNYIPSTTGTASEPVVNWKFSNISREEFEALKKDVEELKRLLINAKELDEITGQPDCEMEEKVELIKRIAKEVGVDLEEVFGK